MLRQDAVASVRRRPVGAYFRRGAQVNQGIEIRDGAFFAVSKPGHGESQMIFRMPARRIGAAIISLALGLSGLYAGHAAADAERGKILYETRCKLCHTSSVHQRKERDVRSYQRLQAQVRRWSAEAGGSWSDEDIDDVALYLNQRYYKFPCAHKACKDDQASLVR